MPVSPQSKLPPLTDAKEALLVAIMPVSDSDLEALAINRAKAVRAYILESGKVEADRLFPGVKAKRAVCVRTEAVFILELN